MGAIGSSEPNVIEALVEALSNDEESAVRGSAANALGAIGSSEPNVIEALVEALSNDEESAVRGSAANALGAIGSSEPNVITALVVALSEDKYDKVRGSAANALGQLSRNSFTTDAALRQIRVSLLSSLNRDSSFAVRASSADALSQSVNFSEDVINAMFTSIIREKEGKKIIRSLWKLYSHPEAQEYIDRNFPNMLNKIYDFKRRRTLAREWLSRLRQSGIYNKFYEENKQLIGDYESHFHQNLVNYFDKANKEYQEMISDQTSNYFQRALFVCVTGNERTAIREALQAKKILIEEKEEHGEFMNTFYWPLDKPAWQIHLFRTMDQRGENAAQLVTKLITQSQYNAVFMIGICMGIRDRIKLHEVLVPRQVFSLAHRRETVAGDKGIPVSFSPPEPSIKRLQSILDTNQKFTFGVHVKQSVCGPWKLEDPDSKRLEEIKNISTEVYGYEMEAEGFFRSVCDRDIDALLVKGVSDFADAPGGSSINSQNKKDNQVAATQNALAVVFAWLEHYINVPPNPR